MLSSIFHHYIQRTKTVCLYGIHQTPIASKLIFPQATTVAVINCSRDGVQDMLIPRHFPNVKTIHYLSAHPGKVDIYRSFHPSVSWVFPNRDYAFYRCMIEAGKGVSNPQLTARYIRKVYKRQNKMEVDLYLPGFGAYRGGVYRAQFLKYLTTPYHPIQHNYSGLDTLFTGLSEEKDKEEEDVSPQSAIQNYVEEKIAREFFEGIMEECVKDELDEYKK